MAPLTKLSKCLRSVDQVLEVTKKTKFFELWKTSPWVASSNFVQYVQGKVTKKDILTVKNHFVKNKIFSENDIRASSDGTTVDNSELCSVLFEKSTVVTEEASSSSFICTKVYQEQVLKAEETTTAGPEGSQEETTNSEGGQEDTASSEGGKEDTTSSEGGQEDTESSEGSQEDTTSSEEKLEETTSVPGCSYIYKQVSFSTSQNSINSTLEQVEDDDGNYEVDFCGGLLSKNKPPKDPEYRQTNQEEPEEIEVAISADHWNLLFDATPTNKKGLKVGWMQVWFIN